MKSKSILLLCLLFILMIGCKHYEVAYDSSATDLPGTVRAMKTAGYWIEQLEDPDKIVLNPEEIELYNAHIVEEFGSVKIITDLTSDLTGDLVIKSTEGMYNYIKNQKLYFADGKKADKAFYAAVKDNLNLDSIPEMITPAYGLTVRYTNQRAMPDDKLLNDIPRELYFDSVQMSALDAATPLAILHESRDGLWYLVWGPMTNGWVKKSDVALCNREDLAKYIKSENFAVVTAAKGELYLNPELTDYNEYIRMGVSLPLLSDESADNVKVVFPTADEEGNLVESACYIPREQVNIGYLPYTSRTTLRQAFKLLNAPYGWGGMFGEQDCSRFIYQVFATVGVKLPRNSSWQTNAGLSLLEFDKAITADEKAEQLVTEATPGVTILKMPGHIMLYIGSDNNTPYVIHSTWAYMENRGLKDNKRVINRTVVSDLNLGEGSKKGSHLSKLTKATNVIPPPVEEEEPLLEEAIEEEEVKTEE